ncbi:hypothetical protein P0D89_50365 [Paraburkholderia sp. RL18-085-BIA-A]
MAMRPFQRIARLERQLTGEHAIEQHTHRIAIGPVIDWTIHAAGLLGGHVRPLAHRYANVLWRDGVLLSRREAEIHQQNIAGFRCDQNIGRPQIPMDDVGGMDARQCIGQVMRDSQAARQVRARAVAQNGLE